MTRDEVLTKLRDLKPWLQSQGIGRVRLFGSYARDEAGPDSDVDLIVELTRPIDLWTFAGLRDEIGKQLGVAVDMSTERGLHDKLRKRILESAVDA